MTLRVALNGFGRIGRGFFRAWLERLRAGTLVAETLEIVAINDQVDTQNLAYLLQYDTVYGRCEHVVCKTEKNDSVLCAYLAADKQEVLRIPLLQQAKLDAGCWQQFAAEWVVEATGVYRDQEGFEKHQCAGAQRVLLTAPAVQTCDLTVVYGINHHSFDVREHYFVSNASCTTHALAVVLAPLWRAFKFQAVTMTELHAYTQDQCLLDSVHDNWRRGRAAASNMIPTQTSGDKTLGLVLPELQERIQGYSMRVPVLNGACLDLTIQFPKAVSESEIIEAFQSSSQSNLQGLLALNKEPLVSSDFWGHTASAIVDLTQIRINGSLAQLLVWYDNEWAYANRLLDFLVSTTE